VSSSLSKLLYAEILMEPFLKACTNSYQFTPPNDDVYVEAQVALLAASLASSLKLDKFVLEGIFTFVISFTATILWS
jgi:hypothetical protein